MNTIYMPGVCNIGPEEIRKRKNFAWTGVAITILAFVLIFISHASAWWELVLFFPGTMAATGFIQASGKFCMGFGFKGIFNVEKKPGDVTHVPDAVARALDKKKAFHVLWLSIAAGILVAIVGVLLARGI